MNCENNFCIYKNKGICILEKINIDGLGMCTECIYPDIDESVLYNAKIKLLKLYQREENDIVKKPSINK